MGGGVAGKVTSLPWEGEKRQSRGQVSEWTIRSASFLFWQVFPYQQPNNQNAPETILRASDTTEWQAFLRVSLKRFSI